MKQITVLSGKGGTGKTTLVASFVALTKRIVVTDCDVDAPNLHLLLKPEVVQSQEFRGLELAAIDDVKCTQCGTCEAACRFGAIKALVVDPILCEGCGVCAYVCPADAIQLNERVSGYAFISKTEYGLLSHARLNPGEENSGKLVTLVRQNARQIAETEGYELIIIDGSPGIGCPVIASVTGADASLVVTEPTTSGIHDLKRALQLLKQFNVQPFVCINKHDLNKNNTKRITSFCKENKIDVLGEIPFNPMVTEAMVNAQPIAEYAPQTQVTKEIGEMWERLLTHQSLKKDFMVNYWEI